MRAFTADLASSPPLPNGDDLDVAVHDEPRPSRPPERSGPGLGIASVTDDLFECASTLPLEDAVGGSWPLFTPPPVGPGRGSVGEGAGKEGG